MRPWHYRKPNACRRAATAAICFWIGIIVAQTMHARPTTLSLTEKTVSGTESRENTCSIIFLGFVGALEPAENKYSGVVQIRDLLRRPEYSEVCAKTYSPYVWTEGRDWLLHHFPSHPGELTSSELERAPRVILVGHSMGGWAMLTVARELRTRGIPVELTVQVDSVGITDVTVPSNVKAGALFHAHDFLMLLTTKRLRFEDASKTRLVADILVGHAGHESITRDPRIRELVLQTITNLRKAAKLSDH